MNHTLKHYGFRAAFISGLMMPLVQLTAYATYIAMAILGSYYVIGGVIVVGQLQAFIQYIWQVSQPMGNILNCLRFYKVLLLLQNECLRFLMNRKNR